MSMWVVAHTVDVAMYCFSLCVAVLFSALLLFTVRHFVTILIESLVQEQEIHHPSQTCVPTGKGLYIQGHSGLPTTRPQLRGRKRNTLLHNTSGPEPSNLTLATRH